MTGVEGIWESTNPGAGRDCARLDPGDGAMPQLHLPMFPAGVTPITPMNWGLKGKKTAWRMLNGQIAVFVHAEDERVATFGMITSSFAQNGRARQCDIVRAFGVAWDSASSGRMKLYRERDRRAYAPRARRGSAVLTAGVVAEIESLWWRARGLGEAAQKLGLKLDTLRKAVSAGRISPSRSKKDRGERAASPEGRR